MSIQSIRVADALLPSPLLIHILAEKPITREAEASQEVQMVAVATLIVKLILDTHHSIQRKQYKDLDANPGDGGCQLRTFGLRALILEGSVQEEIERLVPLLKEISRLLQLRKSGKKECPTSLFFSNHFQALNVSEKLLFVLDCRLLTVTKVKDHVQPNGIIMTKTCISGLSRLSKQIEHLGKEFRQMVLAQAAARLSRNSLEFLQRESEKLQLPLLTRKMILLSKQSQPYKDLPSKTFGFLFYEIQTILESLQNQRALIAIKSVVKEGKPHHLFLREDGPHANELVVVFEGVVSPRLTREKIEEIGFSRLILSCAAQEAPFDPGSKLEDVENREAREEIESYRCLAREIGCVKGEDPLLLLDHVFLNSVEGEL